MFLTVFPNFVCQRANRSLRSLKKSERARIDRKTDERIPNPGFIHQANSE